MAVPRIVEDIARLLETQELGAWGESIFCESMPDDPDTLIYVHQGIGYEADNMPLREIAVQIMTRAPLAEDAHDLAMQVHGLLHRMNHVAIGYHFVLWCTGRLPQALPPDENDRVVYSMDFTFSCRPTQTWATSFTTGTPYPGDERFDHNCLRNLDFAGAGHEDFASLNTAQIFTAVKTFNAWPILPDEDPTDDRHAATKAYVDTHGGGGGTFAGLSDTDFSALTNLDVAGWDEATGKWVNMANPIWTWDEADKDLLVYSASLAHYINLSYAEAGIAAAVHTHDDRYYTETESDTLFATAGHDHDATYAAISHTHVEADITDLGNYSLVGHNHDGRYFQESEFLNASAGVGDAGKPVKLNAAGHVDTTMLNGNVVEIVLVIDGGGTALSTGLKGWVRVPCGCALTGYDLTADQPGSIVIDVWKDTYGNFPPTDADTITGGNEPTLSSAQKAQDTTLTGWTKGLAAGDYLRFSVDSVATVTYVVLTLYAVKV